MGVRSLSPHSRGKRRKSEEDFSFSFHKKIRVFFFSREREEKHGIINLKMRPVHSRLLPRTIGCSFQGVSPELKAQIKRRLRKEGYRVHTVSRATRRSTLLSLDLIIVFIPSFFSREDEAFEEKCLALGRLGPFDQVIDEADRNGPTPGAILETLVQKDRPFV
jgi:hypothetical protein